MILPLNDGTIIQNKECCHTKAKLLSRKLPLQVIWQLEGVDVDVVVSINALNDLPLNLELWFLWKFGKKRLTPRGTGTTYSSLLDYFAAFLLSNSVAITHTFVLLPSFFSQNPE